MHVELDFTQHGPSSNLSPSIVSQGASLTHSGYTVSGSHGIIVINSS